MVSDFKLSTYVHRLLIISVSYRHVLTASHCIQPKDAPQEINPDDSYFVFGAHNLVNLDTSAQKLNIFKFIVHPNWNPRNNKYEGDIAIAKLTSAVQYNKDIRPICLPSLSQNSFDIVGKQGLVAGWGEYQMG
jgi:hypothetical protein